MSRHAVQAKNANHEVVVGWDHPLLTYFMIVYDKRKKGDDRVVAWKGTNLRELYEIADLRRLLHPYAELPMETATMLYGDKDEGR